MYTPAIILIVKFKLSVADNIEFFSANIGKQTLSAIQFEESPRGGTTQSDSVWRTGSKEVDMKEAQSTDAGSGTLSAGGGDGTSAEFRGKWDTRGTHG
ncbi:hypothetical protein BDV98DRAFT_168092 [Pterulicium gracile]|uniref:Uncharacterized protein n=1 Tax=Pterulicium gracile TaxID=1884261 RepID=A0A5C3QM57_9AGAR|nr:hypothetical protein BDV98DRAFT_168092 [Pterula gracilis]